MVSINLDSSLQNNMFFLDLYKAFDYVSRTLHLPKVELLGCWLGLKSI